MSRMYKYLFLISFQFFAHGSAPGQEFLFTMVFMDTMGNSDTLEIGYDDSATESIDTEFGEVDIKDSPWDSIFEVRMTTELRLIDAEPIADFHTKKQIVKKECDLTYPTVIEIDIKAIHWPVTASWNADLFQDSCNKGSLITSIPQGGWWDVGSPSDLDRVELKSVSMISFTDNVNFYNHNDVNPSYAYKDLSGGLVSVFWLALGNEALGVVSTKQYNLYPSLQIIPNPVYEQVMIHGISRTELSAIELYTIHGEKIFRTNDLGLSLSGLGSGLYLLSIVDRNGYRINRKIVKN